MPFVLISHHSADVKLPRDIVPKLAELMPHSVSSAMNLATRKCAPTGERNGSSQPEEVRVDTKPFSPCAQNQPRVSIHISIKAKTERNKTWLKEVRNNVTTDIGNLVQSMALDDGVQFVHHIEVAVDLVPRSWINAGEFLRPLS